MVNGSTGREPITGISSMATRQVLTELARAYEGLSGQPVAIESVGGVDAAQRIQDGEIFDIAILAESAIERLARMGKVDPASRINLARSGIAIAVAAGAPQPDISTEAALREAILNARSIGYSTGPSGTHLVRLFERWGIAETIAPRIVQAPPGVPVGALVARGDIALGFQQSSELIHLAGIDVIGALPQGTQVMTTFAAAICTATSRREAAQALLSFLGSPEAEGAKSANGMEPA
uniref:Putative ATPbinding molybdate transport protein n=1 Tax=termite gut metagenome TaxID=433724 RepID=S0DGR8_9ZZZZ